MRPQDLNTGVFPTWCPGCGDFGIWAAIKSAIIKQNLSGDQVMITYGIGCHGHMVNFMKANGFDGLHGRPVPVAEGVKLANHELPVIAVSGDGDAYGEGLSHFLNAARGNHNVTYIVHNNSIYGLTTGQTSPTTEHNVKTKSTPEGNIDFPINPLAMAITVGATFVSRSFAVDIPFTTELIVKAMQHRGFALVDILQPCPSFNKKRDYNWFRERVYKIENHNAGDKLAAIQKAWEAEKLPIGVFYNENRPSYEDQVSEIKEMPLIKHGLGVDCKKLMEEFL